jgi:hypothetical protein
MTRGPAYAKFTAYIGESQRCLVAIGKQLDDGNYPARRRRRVLTRHFGVA